MHQSNIYLFLVSYKFQHLFDIIHDKYSSIYENNSNQSESNVNAINFGVSVIQWFQYGDTPNHQSFVEEIVNNKYSTISFALLQKYKQECIIKIETSDTEYKYNYDEMLSLKLYTDTTEFTRLFRQSHWNNQKMIPMKKEFYWWAITIYKTFVYHAKFLPRFSSTDVAPMKLYHGINTILAVNERLPKYHGPVSTTLVDTVAQQFSNSEGLLWSIRTTYYNPFNFVVGIDVSWISCHKNEAEILLIDQYLHISNTIQDYSDNDTKIHHLLYKLKIYKTKIVDKAKFWKQMGFGLSSSLIVLIKKHPLLTQTTDLSVASHIGQKQTILDRLVEELHSVRLLNWYRVCHSEFEIIEHPMLNFVSLKIKLNTKYDHVIASGQIKQDDTCFEQSKYKLINIKTQQVLLFEYKEIIFAEYGNKYEIQIENHKLFGTDNYTLQHIDVSSHAVTTFIDNLTIQNGNAITIQNITSFSDDLHNQISRYQFLVCGDDHDEKHAQTLCFNDIKDFYIPLVRPKTKFQFPFTNCLSVQPVNGSFEYLQIESFKTHLSEYIFASENPIIIQDKVDLTGNNTEHIGIIQIFSSSSIIVDKMGCINADFTNDEDNDEMNNSSSGIWSNPAHLFDKQPFIQLVSSQNIIIHGDLIAKARKHDVFCGKIILSANKVVINGNVSCNTNGKILILCKLFETKNANIHPNPIIIHEHICPKIDKHLSFDCFKIDRLMFQLLLEENQIENKYKDLFCKTMGLAQHGRQQTIRGIQEHPLLLHTTDILTTALSKKKTVLDRLIEELQVVELLNWHRVSQSKFEITDYGLLNIASCKIKMDTKYDHLGIHDNECFVHSEYKLIASDLEEEKTFAYDQLIFISRIQTYQIHVTNKQLFGDETFNLQTIDFVDPLSTSFQHSLYLKNGNSIRLKNCFSSDLEEQLSKYRFLIHREDRKMSKEFRFKSIKGFNIPLISPGKNFKYPFINVLSVQISKSCEFTPIKRFVLSRYTLTRNKDFNMNTVIEINKPSNVTQSLLTGTNGVIQISCSSSIGISKNCKIINNWDRHYLHEEYNPVVTVDNDSDENFKDDTKDENIEEQHVQVHALANNENNEEKNTHTLDENDNEDIDTNQNQTDTVVENKNVSDNDRDEDQHSSPNNAAKDTHTLDEDIDTNQNQIDAVVENKHVSDNEDKPEDIKDEEESADGGGNTHSTISIETKDEIDDVSERYDDELKYNSVENLNEHINDDLEEESEDSEYSDDGKSENKDDNEDNNSDNTDDSDLVDFDDDFNEGDNQELDDFCVRHRGSIILVSLSNIKIFGLLKAENIILIAGKKIVNGGTIKCSSKGSIFICCDSFQNNKTIDRKRTIINKSNTKIPISRFPWNRNKNIDRKIKLIVKKHRGHYDNALWSNPKNLFKPPNEEAYYYFSNSEDPKTDWIILEMKNQFLPIKPTKIIIKNSDDKYAIRAMRVEFGTGNEWNLLCDIPKIHNKNTEEQEFLIQNNHIDWVKFGFSNIKIKILKNHGDPHYNSLLRFSLFGYTL
eukprot:235555_1